MDNITACGSVEELKEESNLIIYIVGLIMLIIWKVPYLTLPYLTLPYLTLPSHSLIFTVEQYG